jgi:GNAT superfamily N-acetyltransferase
LIDYSIRRATEDDAEELARLRWEFSLPTQQAAQPFADFREPFRAFLMDGFATGQWVAWVAESNGQIIGNVYLQLVPKIPRAGRFGYHWGYVSNVYMIPERRGAGIGAALMAEVQAWALREQLEFLVLWPSERSVPFYERAGFALDQDALIWETPARMGSDLKHPEQADHDAKS